MDRLLNPVLSKLGHGWKTSLALGAYLVLHVLVSTGKVSIEQADAIQPYILLLFGVGVYHKVTSPAK